MAAVPSFLCSCLASRPSEKELPIGRVSLSRRCTKGAFFRIDDVLGRREADFTSVESSRDCL